MPEKIKQLKTETAIAGDSTKSKPIQVGKDNSL
jgi:hypothetical protein